MIATNITELIRSPEADRLLRLCNERIENTDGSDYAYFCAICHALPLLEGHPFAEYLSNLFLNALSVKTEISPKTADQIWQESAGYLLAHPVNINHSKSFPKPKEILFSLQKNTDSIQISNAQNLALTKTTSWESWKKELDEVWHIRLTCNLILLSIGDELPFKMPAVYHVDKALKEPPRPTPILWAQVLRFLCINCQKSKKTLMLESSNQNATALIALLDRLEAEVGLPDIILSVAGIKPFEALLSFVEKPHQCNIRMGINASVKEIYEILDTVRSVYPIHRLFLYQKNGNDMQIFSVQQKE